ncbi:carbohydrate ABC transporter permease [Paenibacillus beijingensis]|uniref:Sugar ABC transporter permease n=1 Tax=Paenibacillus beijingensis TaxID=1126833 RepID=A0A0D5NJ80_9BACL|nr:carbohydrate ABC transporter permease [Paenibacillus beijingensis]AJY75434.1 sugar ABC transporter permease [Paenibacillus beijingensis]
MKSTRNLWIYAPVAVMALLSLIPFYILLYLSLNTPSRTMFDGVLMLPDFHFANYVEAWKSSKIGTATVNSLIITVGGVAIIVAASSMAGYAIARYSNKFHAVLFNTLLICMMIPAIIITVPLYSLMKSIGGINTHWAMILLMASNGLPFAVFLYTGFIKGLPREVEESAIIDGCTPFTAFWRVTFHFLRPVTAAVVILQGLAVWNNYGQAVFFLQRESMRTIPLAVSMFFQQYGAQWNLMAAASVIGLAPAVAAFLLFQKYFIKGITAGAVKG